MKYFHVLIETTQELGRNSKKSYVEFDLTKDRITKKIIAPFLTKGGNVIISGNYLDPEHIYKILIYSSIQSSTEINKLILPVVQAEYNKYKCISPTITKAPNYYILNSEYLQDITDEIMDNFKEENNSSSNNIGGGHMSNTIKNSVFIVHGHDEAVREAVARFIEKQDLKAIILNEQASNGKSIIEKIEENSNVGFGIVLYTPCDFGGKSGEDPKPRARQNVVFEHGFLIGKLGRNKVTAIVKDDIETPNDTSGIVYIPYDSHQGWQSKLARELSHAGYNIDMNNLLN